MGRGALLEFRGPFWTFIVIFFCFNLCVNTFRFCASKLKCFFFYINLGSGSSIFSSRGSRLFVPQTSERYQRPAQTRLWPDQTARLSRAFSELWSNQVTPISSLNPPLMNSTAHVVLYKLHESALLLRAPLELKSGVRGKPLAHLTGQRAGHLVSFECANVTPLWSRR